MPFKPAARLHQPAAGYTSPWLSHRCPEGFHLLEARGLSRSGLRPLISSGFSADVFPQTLIPLTQSRVSVALASAGATFRSAFGGERMYLSYAELFHLPACWMSQLGSPTVAASVAAPILRLWLLY